eukprot:CAMPEP_0204557532 /NCGR_PEP_ID=MMETSP0661-20131031/30394_1 /ASSEMBLY_ACC=CAM_ASM_000606 /TAXON_ID=109239 /ORGANISM="Alexandrium margalefi, Strain AMGDE01CS-322" /LENGTH=50 /DNA_ID=CAMNT_0051564665 /DNA_START=38 /DNA_END=187 /DNA_ORIENTATION=+
MAARLRPVAASQAWSAALQPETIDGLQPRTTDRSLAAMVLPLDIVRDDSN